MYAVSITVPITMDGVAMTTLVWKGNNVERSVHVVGLNPILTEVIGCLREFRKYHLLQRMVYIIAIRIRDYFNNIQ